MQENRLISMENRAYLHNYTSFIHSNTDEKMDCQSKMVW